MKAAAALARRLAGLRLDEVTSAARDRVGLHLLDTLGVMCAGHRAVESSAILAVCAGAAGHASVVGRAEKLTPADAAFCNAFLGRAHTFDDTYENGPVHPGSPVVAAALAAAEMSGAGGPALLEAVLVGYETAVRVSRAAGPGHYGAGFHSSGTINAFAAAAAAAKALDLDEAGFTSALGHAGGGASGLRQYQVDGALSDSALNGARAAAWGVRAAQLAQAGVAAAAGILDGPWGFLSVMCPAPETGALDAPGQAGEAVLAVSLKPYPSCRFTHGPVDELRRLRAESSLRPDDVDEVVVETFRQSIEVSDKPVIATRSDAILSHQFAAACVLLTGDITLDAFERPLLEDTRVRTLAGRVRVRHDPALDAAYPAAWPHRVSVRLRDGAQLHAVSEHPPGTPQQPLTPFQVEAKFASLCAPLLGDARMGALRAAVAGLKDAALDARGLTELLRGT